MSDNVQNTIPQEAVEYLRQAQEAESVSRNEALGDLRFVSLGEQWPVAQQNQRALESRPVLTINKLDSYLRQVTNNQRQQRPRGKVHPVNDTSDKKIAEVLTGIGRHVEVASDADLAYDTAFDFAVRAGRGFMRLDIDYAREDSFDLDFFIRPIFNPFSVYFDYNSVLPDGSDAEKCIITDILTKAEFKRQFPGAEEVNFSPVTTGDSAPVWLEKDNIRIAEYFRIVRDKDKLYRLSNGMDVWQSELPPLEQLKAAGITIGRERVSWKKAVKWSKVTQAQELETKIIPGKFIPVIPVEGCRITIDGKTIRYGMVRFAKDPAMMYNFWRTAMTETVALAPKAKWLGAEGFDEGHENEFAQANNRTNAVLRFKTTGVDGSRIEPPQHIQSAAPPEGAMAMSEAMGTDLQAVIGIFDPSMGKPSGPKSGKAIRAEQGQSDNGTFHYYDNLTRSIRQVWKIMLGQMPSVYTEERMLRIIGEDGKPDMVSVNQPQQQVDPETQAVETIIKNNVTVGEYDVVMDTGPGFNTKRLEEQDAFSQLMGTAIGEKVSEVGADLVVRAYDSPGMDVLADRLAAANPLSQIDEKSDVPPQAQMMIKQLQKQVQDMQQQMQQQALVDKFKIAPTQMKIAAEQQRHQDNLGMEQKRLAVHVAERTAIDDTKRHDVAVRNSTTMAIAELQGYIDLILQGKNADHELRSQILDAFHQQEQQYREADVSTVDEQTPA